MTRTTTGHPVRALRGAGMLLAAWIACRLPAMRTAFDAVIAVGAAPRPATAPHAPGTAVVDDAAVIVGAVPTRVDARSPKPHVVVVRSHPAPAIVPTTAKLDRAAAPLPAIERQSPAIGDTTASPVASTTDYATQAYARLAAGDRRAAVRLFDAALAGGDDPRAGAWRAQRRTLTRHWSASIYGVMRARGPAGPAASPVLGGGQSGATIAWRPHPLAFRPVALTLRATAAHDDGGRGALAAVGVAWQPVPGVTLAAERLFAVGSDARDGWTARVAGGIARRRGLIDAAAYGEAGVVGGTAYLAAQARVGGLLHRGRVDFGSGVGLWGSLQRGGGTVDRLDLGPGIVARVGALSLAADYRFRVAGNAAPRSGPVVTLTAGF